MLHERRSGLTSLMASILAMSWLLPLTQTRAQLLRALDQSPPQNETNPTGAANQPGATREEVAKQGNANAADANLHSGPATEPDPALPSASTLLRVLDLPSAKKLTPLDQAYLDVYSILRDDNDCSRFYGGSRAIEALNRLKLQLKTSYLDRGIAMRMFGPTSNVTNNRSGLSYRLFAKAEINVNGPFYSKSPSLLGATTDRIGDFLANSREARVTILLHELGHLVRASETQFVLPNDGNDSALSHQNTLRVIAVCRREITKQTQIGFAAVLAKLHPDSENNSLQAAPLTRQVLAAWPKLAHSAQ